jgi:alkylation response protein AidB-like acyl-CoA dehydrogenase
VTSVSAADRARHIAETVLYPSAMAVDELLAIPAAQLNELADAGLYGIAGPPEFGGLAADLPAFCQVVEILASGCLATTFVWLQHHGAVRALAASPNHALRDAWLGPLVTGQRRAGVALGGARPGPVLLQARRVPGGYELDGRSPWVTGWGMVDVLYTLARGAGPELIAALIPARPAATLTARRLDLVAVNASATVELSFAGHFVPDEQVSSVVPQAEWLAADSRGLRPNGSLALGVAARCCRLAGPGPLDAELGQLRARLDGADADSMPAARAAAAAFAFRAAGAAVAVTGSGSILAGQHPQRLARESLFLLVFGSRPAIRENIVRMLVSG